MTRVVQETSAGFGSPGQRSEGAATGVDGEQLSAGLVLSMPPSRRSSVRAARNALAVISLIGFLGSSDWLVREVLGGAGPEWGSPVQHVSYLTAVSCLQACFVLTGMNATHTILRHPPHRVPGFWATRMVGLLVTVLVAAALHAAAAQLDPAGLSAPRFLLAAVLAYPLVMTLSELLLALHPLRRHAAAISILALAAWLVWALAVGPERTRGAGSAVQDSVTSCGGVEPSTLVAVLALGYCYWAGALMVALGDLLDSRGRAFRWSMRLLSLLGFVLLIPQAAVGASLGHLMLAIALTALLDLRLPRALGRHDIWMGVLFIGWPLSIVLSHLLTGESASVPGSVAACLLAVAAAKIGRAHV